MFCFCIELTYFLCHGQFFAQAFNQSLCYESRKFRCSNLAEQRQISPKLGNRIYRFILSIDESTRLKLYRTIRAVPYNIAFFQLVTSRRPFVTERFIRPSRTIRAVPHNIAFFNMKFEPRPASHCSQHTENVARGPQAAGGPGQLRRLGRPAGMTRTRR